MALSSDKSATSFFSLPFSSSNCFSRRISSGNNPSYLFFQLKYVAWLIPALRQISATGCPSAPCFKINVFCASVNLDAFIVFHSSRPRKITVENSNFEWSNYPGAEHLKETDD